MNYLELRAPYNDDPNLESTVRNSCKSTKFYSKIVAIVDHNNTMAGLRKSRIDRSGNRAIYRIYIVRREELVSMNMEAARILDPTPLHTGNENRSRVEYRVETIDKRLWSNKVAKNGRSMAKAPPLASHGPVLYRRNSATVDVAK